MDDLERRAFLKYWSLSELRRLMIEAYGTKAVNRGHYYEEGKLTRIDVPSIEEIKRLEKACL